MYFNAYTLSLWEVWLMRAVCLWWGPPTETGSQQATAGLKPDAAVSRKSCCSSWCVLRVKTVTDEPDITHALIQQHCAFSAYSNLTYLSLLTHKSVVEGLNSLLFLNQCPFSTQATGTCAYKGITNVFLCVRCSRWWCTCTLSCSCASACSCSLWLCCHTARGDLEW